MLFPLDRIPGLIVTAIWLNLQNATMAEAITVYDCNDNQMSYRSINLLEPAACPDPEDDYENPKNVTVQILQADRAFPIVGYQCRATISKEVVRCGFDSITYGSSWPVWEQDADITPGECRRAVHTKRMTIQGLVYDGLKAGTLYKKVFFSEGGVDEDGRCDWRNFETAGTMFRYSYQRTYITIEIRHVRGNVDLSTGQIVFGNGLRANFKDQVLRDNLEGTVVWNDTIPDCQETLSQVYLGPGQIHQVKEQPGILNSIILVRDQKTNQYAGLILKAPTSICSVHCYSTQIKGLTLCIMREYDTPLQARFNPAVNMGDVDIQTQLSYLTLSAGMQTDGRFETVQDNICKVERRTLYNKLQAIAGADNPYALIDVYGRGFTLYKAGAVAYIAKCAPKEATRAQFANCTEEIPVMVNKTLKFADPFTWVIRDFPVIVPCSDLMPVQWNIRGTWYCSTPRIQKCPTPETLNITLMQPLQDVEFTQGVGHGIYTDQQLEQHHAFTVAAQSRQAVLTDTTNHATAGSPSPGQLGIPLGVASIDELTDILGRHYFPFFWFLGKAWNYFIGVMIFVAIVKVTFSCLVRGYIIFLENGCGPWMIGAFWETLFIIVRTPGAIVGATLDSLTTPEGPDVLSRFRRWVSRGSRGQTGAKDDDSDNDDDEGKGEASGPSYPMVSWPASGNPPGASGDPPVYTTPVQSDQLRLRGAEGENPPSYDDYKELRAQLDNLRQNQMLLEVTLNTQAEQRVRSEPVLSAEEEQGHGRLQTFSPVEEEEEVEPTNNSTAPVTATYRYPSL